MKNKEIAPETAEYISNYAFLDEIDKELINEPNEPSAFEPTISLENIFIPNWDNKPPFKEPVLKLGNESILSYQNISCIIAQPGAGKSSTMESIVSSVINKESDNLGFSTTVNSVLYIDFERTETDVWNSFYRTMQRAKIEQGRKLEKIKIVSFRNIRGAEKRKEKIIELLTAYKFEILLLDGVGDLVNDTNSLAEAENLTDWIRYITGIYKVSIFTTLHPNKGTVTPRGHIGSEILREAENVLLIEVNKDKSRTLTTDFTHGKSRNGKHANSSFIWSDELMMFVSTEFVVTERKIKEAPQEKFEHQELINLVSITHPQKLTASETIEKLTNYLKTTVSYVKTDNNSIKSFLKFLIDNNYLISLKDEKDKRTTYYLQNKNI
jgi:hypothetical protein